MTAPEDPRPQAPGQDDVAPARPRPAAEKARAAVARSRPEPGTGSVEVPATEPVATEPAATGPGAQEPRAVEPVTARRRPGRRGRWLVAGALLALAVLAGYLGYRVQQADAREQARQQALTAARQSALNISSISTQNFAQNVAAVLDGATGQFRQDFSARTGQLEQLLKDNDVSATGSVLEAALQRADRNSATALVVVDSTVKNKQVPEGRTNNYRMKIQVEKVGDRWLTSSLEFVA